MSRVLTFSRIFPTYHPRKGESTFFVEKIWKGLEAIGFSEPVYLFDELQVLSDLIHGKVYCTATAKNHTVRAGNRWKVGDKFSPRVWSGKPYASKQIIIAPDIEIKKVWDISIVHYRYDWFITTKEGKPISIDMLAKNDGLTTQDFMNWFKRSQNFKGQIICWNENINY